MRLVFNHRRSLVLVGALIVVAVVVMGTFSSDNASAQAGWVIRSFDVRYVIAEDGTFTVEEDILVDFGSLQRHGIFRELPVEFDFDADNNRLMASRFRPPAMARS